MNACWLTDLLGDLGQRSKLIGRVRAESLPPEGFLAPYVRCMALKHGFLLQKDNY